MPTTIIFNDERKGSRLKLQVDEEPDQVAAALARNPIPRFTEKGSPVWVSAASVRLLRPQRSGGGGGGGAAGGRGGGAQRAKGAGAAAGGGPGEAQARANKQSKKG